MRRLASLWLFLALIGCVPASADPTGAPSATVRPAGPTAIAAPPPSASPAMVDRVAGWRSDLAGLVPGMAAIHPDLFHDTPRVELDRAITELTDRAPTLTDDELMVGAVRVVAMVSARGRDAHTGLYPWSPASRFHVHSLPFRLWLFPDGIHVIASLDPADAPVGARIVTIAGHPVDDVVRALDPLIPRDNDATVRLLTPRYLLIPEVLHGLGLIDDVGPIELGVVDGAGGTRTVSVDPIPMDEYNAWAGPYGLFLPADPNVLYLSRMEEPIWWSRLDDDQTLFVQYNRVEFLGIKTLQDLAAAAASAELKRVVVDLRHDFGGEVRALEPVLDALDPASEHRPGRLFLITGRNTFSAASLFAAKLQARTDVTIVGAPMGGSPNCWGDPEDLTLAWSGLSVGVATQFELATTTDDDRLTIEPDVAVPVTFADWAAGRDAALEAILTRD